MLPTIAREDDTVVMIDQRKLPAEEVYVRCKTAAEVARAIRTMVIRGAPAIGVAAAYGIALGIRKSKSTGTQKLAAEFYRTCEQMAATRPTAVNLFWAIDRMKRAFAAAANASRRTATRPTKSAPTASPSLRASTASRFMSPPRCRRSISTHPTDRAFRSRNAARKK